MRPLMSNKVEGLLCYVISVRSFSDRHIAVSKAADSLGLSLEFIWDFDIEERHRFSEFCIETMPEKSASCVLKHIEAQRRLINSGAEYALVVEDDVIFLPDFLIGLQAAMDQMSSLPGGWLIFLGGADNRWPKSFWRVSSEYELVEAPITTAEAYLIDRDGARARLKWLEQNKISLPADHFLASLDPALDLTQYRITVAIAGQASITGKIKTSLDENRVKHGSGYLLLRYGWNRFRKQLVPLFLFRLLKTLRVI